LIFAIAANQGTYMLTRRPKKVKPAARQLDLPY
jgi:hypothetical protein